MPVGQQLDLTGGERIYDLDLEAGTAVDITVGPFNTLGFEMFIYGPGSHQYSTAKTTEHLFQAEDIYGVRVTPPFKRSELLSLAANVSGRYRLRLVPPTDRGSQYSIFVSSPRPAVDRDAKLAEAAQLMYRLMGYYRGKVKAAEAADLAEMRAAIFRKIGDPYSLALSLERLSNLRAVGGDPHSVIRHRLEARSILLDIGRPREAVHLTPCAVYYGMGDFQAWVHCTYEAVALTRRHSLKQEEAAMLRNIGMTYHMLADETRAREYFLEAMSIWRSLGSSEAELYEQAQLFKDLGNMKQGIAILNTSVEFYPTRTESDLREAISYYRRGLELDSRLPSPRFKGYFLWQIGAATRDLGDIDEALNLFDQALQLYRNNPPTVSLIWTDLAQAYIAMGEKQRARELLQKGLPQLSRIPVAKERVADLWIALGEPGAALDIYAADLNTSQAGRDVGAMARHHAGVARAERAIGNFSNARDHILSAIELTEALRDRIMDEDVRSTYFAAAKKYHNFYIDLLMQMHKSQPERHLDKLAFEASERSRSRNLLDLLNRSGIDIRQGVDPQLLSAEKELRDKLAAAHLSQVRAASGEAPEGSTLSRSAVAALVQQQQALDAEIRRQSPRYASITPAGSVPVEDVQGLVDSGTVLLEFHLGDQRSYLWVIGHDGLTSYELPSREELERAVTAAFAAMQTFEKAKAPERLSGNARFNTAVEWLSEKLFAPAMNQIEGKRLLIVPDGALNYVPWAALPQPGDSSVRLVQHHEIVVLPSASVLSLLRRQTAGRGPRPSAELITVFADPVFTSKDERLRRRGRRIMRPEALSSSLGRDLDLALTGSSVEGILPRLGFSRREANSIAGASRRPSSVHLDFDASKTALLSKDLEKYRILHFATHGLIDNSNPALSGLVLSLVDRQGNDVDGFLRMQDIYNLKLNADLVVLSACNTALGREVRGEGIVGLTRGFMYAGSPRVVASLWKVDDAATAHFMSVFYKKMLVEHMRPAAALRAAQNEMMKQRRWRSPYYWAPFVLQGEWK